MSKQWWEESPEVLAAGFSAETTHRTRLDAEALHTATMHADGTLVIEPSAEDALAMPDARRDVQPAELVAWQSPSPAVPSHS